MPVSDRRKIVEVKRIKKVIINYFTDNRAFTLIEILTVLIILMFIFSTLTLIFTNLYSSSLRVIATNSELSKHIKLFWDIERAIYSSKKVIIKNGTQLYLITAGGLFHDGVVKAVFLYQNNTLYYYETPYPQGSIFSYEKGRLIKLANLKKFLILALHKGQIKYNSFKKEKIYKLYLDNETFIINTF